MPEAPAKFREAPEERGETHVNIEIWILLILAGVAAYMLVVNGLMIWTKAKFGWRGEEFIERTVGLPFWLLVKAIAASIDKVHACLRWSQKQNNRRRWAKAFGGKPIGSRYDRDGLIQTRIDSTLAYLAGEMEKSFVRQHSAREARKHHKSWWSFQSMVKADNAAEEAKDRFWEAHSIAASFGFTVRASYKDYLSSTRPTARV